MKPFQAFTEKSNWDTGATRTSISKRAATLLKLKPIRQTTIFIINELNNNV